MSDYSIKEIFENKYSIPIYQRAYAWTEMEINTLIDDVYDYYVRDNSQKYYIGSLVVHTDNDDVISVIDGQQRLTTLSLVICYLKNETEYQDLINKIDVMLNFESRKRSTDIICALKNKDKLKKVIDLDNELVDGYRTIRKKFLEKNDSTSSFKFDKKYFQYLLENVILIKNELPRDTDLNHYFEIMNNRGEQLEKHEIVKSYLIGLVSKEDEKAKGVISEVWNACQRLDKYVQVGFKPNVRDSLFSKNWDKFVPKDFKEVISAFTEEYNLSISESLTIDDILEKKTKALISDETDDTGRYHSIINFPNFLLQVLKLYKNKEVFNWNDESKGVSLDDKRLVNQFKKNISSDKEVYEFMYLLLKIRFIFDNYVIKTDGINDTSSDDSNWCLHKPHMVQSYNKKKLSPRNTFYNNDRVQDIVIKIESMFQVTDSRQIYKSFLFGLLQILNDYSVANDEKKLIRNLIDFANQRFISLVEDKSIFDSGVNTPNYIFNYLDFVLWYQETDNSERGIKASDFEFKYRNSVEHFYPQNPNEAEGHKKLGKNIVDNFGNLCIMSRVDNSLRNNLVPSAKIAEYKSKNQSLKFELMQNMTKEDGVWGEKQISKHGIEMKDILFNFIKIK